MDKLYQDTMTRKMRHDLSRFCYEQGFLEYDEQPSIGHWPDDAPAGNKSTAAPDPHYFATAGEEPPPPPKRHWLHWFVRNYELCVTLVAVAGFLIILALCQV
jgi:hypothetical protein